MRYKDLTGLRIGKLTVLEPTEQRVRNAVVWRCRCDCGNEILVESRRLKQGVIYSCGCEPSPDEADKNRKDLTGLRFGKLTVLGRSGNKAKDGNLLWLCKCDCGNTIEMTKRRLITGNTRSCGCGKKRPLKDWTGKKFGMLTVVSYAGKEKGFHLWHCRCDCGNLHYTDGTCLEMLRPEVMYKTNTSGVKGVYYSKKRKKWIAQIMFRQKCYYLGGYDQIKDAAEARAEAEKNIFGDFIKWYEKERKTGDKK